MKTVFIPVRSRTNHYIDIVTKAIEENGYDILDKYDFRSIVREKIGIANFNWPDGLGVLLKICFFRRIFRFSKRIAYVWFLKAKGTKIIYTFHDKYGRNPDGLRLSMHLMRFMCRRADRIVILCDETNTYLDSLFKNIGERNKLGKKTVKIPHPNYSTVYPECGTVNERLSSLFVKGQFSLLFFGKLQQYKNLEIILEMDRRLTDLDINIIIAGKAFEAKGYADEINEKIEKSGHIVLWPQFIPDDEIVPLIRLSDCVILPYDTTTVLNSGAVMLALTAGKPLICPEIGTTREIGVPLKYVYSYKDSEQHANELEKKIRNAYADFKNDPTLFAEEAITVQKHVLREFSYEKTKRKYAALYQELLLKQSDR